MSTFLFEHSERCFALRKGSWLRWFEESDDCMAVPSACVDRPSHVTLVVQSSSFFLSRSFRLFSGQPPLLVSRIGPVARITWSASFAKQSREAKNLLLWTCAVHGSAGQVNSNNREPERSLFIFLVSPAIYTLCIGVPISRAYHPYLIPKWNGFTANNILHEC